MLRLLLFNAIFGQFCNKTLVTLLITYPNPFNPNLGPGISMRNRINERIAVGGEFLIYLGLKCGSIKYTQYYPVNTPPNGGIYFKHFYEWKMLISNLSKNAANALEIFY